MIKQLLVGGALLGAAVGAQAQDVPALPAAPVPPASAAIVPPGPDSVQAVRTLFRKRRNGGTIYTAAGGLVLLRGVLSGPYASGLGVSAAVSAPLLFIGIRKLLRFDGKKEDAVVKQYQQGKALPPDIRKRLRAEYFAPTR